MGKGKFITSQVLVETFFRIRREGPYVGIGTVLFTDLINSGQSLSKTKRLLYFESVIVT